MVRRASKEAWGYDLNVDRLRTAWGQREDEWQSSGAIRMFHGETEAPGDPVLSRTAIEVFRDVRGAAYAWIFTWEQGSSGKISESDLQEVSKFLISKGVMGIVHLARPEKGAPEDARVVFGTVPEFLDAKEETDLFRIRFEKTKHPGLFLDHLPLRQWLRTSGVVAGKSVLNTFSYTGSLSVAAKRGGASKVLTLDLSRPTIGWAKENWELNFPGDGAGDFIFGDVFEWLPKLKKRGDRFDVVILDPPSFSRSPKKVFSTAKDLPGLHAAALQILNPGGYLITSINSAQITPAQYRKDISDAAASLGRKLTEVMPLGAPKTTFPGADYLKGWVFRVN